MNDKPKKDRSQYVKVGSKHPRTQELIRLRRAERQAAAEAVPPANATNPVRGAAFEIEVQAWLASQRIHVAPRFSIPVGASTTKRPHAFDLGSAEPPVLVECKCHTWTIGGNAPSAKLTVWNEAMHYFAYAPREYRKLLVVSRSIRNGETLAQHYVRRYGHLVPAGVELWELDPIQKWVGQLYVGA